MWNESRLIVNLNLTDRPVQHINAIYELFGCNCNKDTIVRIQVDEIFDCSEQGGIGFPKVMLCMSSLILEVSFDDKFFEFLSLRLKPFSCEKKKFGWWHLQLFPVVLTAFFKYFVNLRSLEMSVDLEKTGDMLLSKFLKTSCKNSKSLLLNQIIES